jgi:hypothetical protein
MPIQSLGGKARKPLKIRGFEAVKRVFLPTRFGEEPKNLTNLIVFDAFSAKISDSTQFFCFIHIPFPTQLDV